jgi:peptidoglycan/LPS O-acetylase OafA/YrhL
LIEMVVQRLHVGALNRGVMVVLVTIATVGVAETSFYFIEQPLLRLKTRFHS